MSKKDEKLKELEDKIDAISRQLESVLTLIHEDNLSMGQFVRDSIKNVAVASSEMRDSADRYGEKQQLSLYYKGLVMGLLFGVLGNLLVAYFMKLFEFTYLPLWSWLVSLIFLFAGVVLLAFLMYRQIKQISAQGEEKTDDSQSSKKKKVG